MTIFSKFGPDHLLINIDSDISTTISHVDCLVQPCNGKIQRLFTVMKSESAANAILHGARELRHSSDMKMSSFVYVHQRGSHSYTEATFAYGGQVVSDSNLRIHSRVYFLHFMSFTLLLLATSL